MKSLWGKSDIAVKVSLRDGAVTTLPDLPFVPNLLWGNGSDLYITASRIGDNVTGRLDYRIGRIRLDTGEVSVIAELPPPGGSVSSVIGAIWGDAGNLYVAQGGQKIYSIDLNTKSVTPLAGFLNGVSSDRP